MTSIPCLDCDGKGGSISGVRFVECPHCHGYQTIDPLVEIKRLREELNHLGTIHNRVANEVIGERITRTFDRLANDLQYMLTDKLFEDNSSHLGMLIGAGMVAWWRNIKKILEPAGLDWQEAFVAFYGCMRELSMEIDGATLRRLSSDN